MAGQSSGRLQGPATCAPARAPAIDCSLPGSAQRPQSRSAASRSDGLGKVSRGCRSEEAAAHRLPERSSSPVLPVAEQKLLMEGLPEQIKISSRHL